MTAAASTPASLDGDLAVVGMAGRFPGAANLAEYWENLRTGVESISFFSREELIASGVHPALAGRPDYVPAAPILDDPSLFDAAFFGYSPREARFIDPQQRLFLECAWEAVEHAGYDPERYDGPIGVYGGAAINTYLLFSGLLPRFVDEYLLTLSASDKDFLATRVAYKLNLTGPAVTVQSACSTSLVAVHLAARSLLDGECEMALAGGVSVRVPQRAGHLYEEGSIFTPDGHCRAFDARAGGTIFGSGVGIVVLKRLADAVADRDTIHAVVKGTAVNNDGSGKVNYTAPSVERQAAAVAEALANADVDAATVSYVEAHGTGTRVGDPIEVAALTRAFRAFTEERGYCAIGSVKTNIGHLDAAAGVAGLIKTVLALEHAEIPASLHFEQPNPEIDFESTPFRVNDTLSPWRAGPTPRRAAVNALGVGGTNAHVILEEAPPKEPAGPSRRDQLLLLSARTGAALDAATSALADHLGREPVDLSDVAYTLQVGRRELEHRRVVRCRERGDALAGLETLDARRVRSGRCDPAGRDVVFMFPGQGTQHVGMGAELYRSEPEFRERLDRVAELFRPRLRLDLRSILSCDGEDAEEAAAELDRTAVAQPALFAVEHALAGALSSFGLRPQALVGHSIGELTAACCADVFSLEDAVEIVSDRGRLLQALPEGAMLAVPLAEEKLLPYLDGELSLAAVNAASQCVVAGGVDEVRELERRLREDGIRSHALRVSRAFHSAATDPIVEAFRECVERISLRPPRIPFVSNVTGTWIRADEATDPGYWARQLRETVRLRDGFEELARGGGRALVEVGPGHTLCGYARRQPAPAGERVVVPTLGAATGGRTETEALLGALGELWLAGVEVDWADYASSERRRRVPLPTYPFERRRYWVESQDRSSGSSNGQRAEPEPPAGEPVSPRPQPQRPVAPSFRTPVEAAVVGVWQRVLERDGIEVDDNFYDLGGHSILIPQVVGRLSEIFQIDLPPLSLVESPTVAELAGCIEDVCRSEGGVARATALGPVERRRA
jgi:phthiocerol/phenolphthiocerol synthesis type-I polyketide synthase E